MNSPLSFSLSNHSRVKPVQKPLWFRPGPAFLSLFLLAGSNAPAGTFGWKSPPVSGAFNSPGSWLNAGGGGGYPGAGDDAIFVSGTYTVTCDGSASGLTELIGTVTFQLDGDYTTGAWFQGGNPVVVQGGGTLQGGPFTVPDGSILVDGSELTMNGFDFGTSTAQTRLTAKNGAKIKSSGQVNFVPRPRLENASEWNHTGALDTGRCFVTGGSLLAADQLTVGPAELDGGRLQAGVLKGSGLAKNGSAITADSAALSAWVLDGGGNSMLVSGLITSAANASNSDITIKAGATLTAGAISDSAWYTVDGSGSQLAVNGGLTAAGTQPVTVLNQGKGSAGIVTGSYITVRDAGSLFNFATMAEDSTMLVQNGGRVNGALFRGPMSAGRTAGVSVSGAGSAMVLSGNLELGAFAQGSLTISDGGRVDCARGFLDGGQTGVTSSSSVFGAGSFWLNNGGMAVGATRGVGVLNIGGAGRVEVRGTAFGIGLDATGEGRVDVDGGALPLPSVLDSRLTVETGVGAYGKGKLSVRAKGRVLTGKLTLGVYGTADGTVEVIGAGTSLVAGGTLHVGHAGKGLMTVFAGGLATAPDVLVGSSSGTNLLRLTGANSSLTVANSLHVGETGDGQLSLEPGTKVTLTGPLPNGQAIVAHGPGSNGTITVNGTGAALSGAEGLLIVGSRGHGTLNVTGGGDVNFRVIAIGGEAIGTGVATVSGTGSVLRSPSLITIGGVDSSTTGAGELTVSAGGLVRSGRFLDVFKPGTLRLTGGSAIVGQTSEAAIPGTVLVANFGEFRLGGRLIGSVLVRPGGTLLPGSSPGKATMEGNVTMAAGTSLEIELGANGAGTGYDQIEATGTVSLAGHFDIVFRDGFAPANGQVFDVVKGSSVTGNFADVTVRGLAPGFTYTLANTGGNILRLTAASAGVSVTKPELNIVRTAGGNVIVSWPAYLTGWTLQRSTSLPTGNWQPVAAPDNSFTVTAASGAAFFRLARP